MKNNFMNQLLRLPLLKYTHKHTHTHTHTQNIYIHIIKKKNHNNKKKAVPPSLPRKKRDSYNTPNGGSHGNSVLNLFRVC